MPKLVFTSPSQHAAEAAVRTLQSLGIDESSITVVADEHFDPADTTAQDPIDTSDAIPAAQRGAVVGGTVGLLAGLAAVAFPPAGIVIGGGAVLGAAAAGASFGTFAAALVGTSVNNSQLRDFEGAVRAGQLLLVATVPDDRAQEIETCIVRQHPDITSHGSLDSLPSAL